MLYELYDAHNGRRPLGGRLRRHLRPQLQRAAPRRLDLGRRRRPARSCPAWCATTRSAARRDHPRPALHRVAHAARLHLPGHPLRQLAAPTPTLPPMGLRLRLKADYDISGFPREVQVDPAGAQEVRHDRGRQRLRLVHLRRARRALGRRRPAQPVPGPGQRLRGRRLHARCCPAPSTCRCRRRAASGRSASGRQAGARCTTRPARRGRGARTTTTGWGR